MQTETPATTMPTSWGNWRVRKYNHTLEHVGRVIGGYQIDLEDLSSAKQTEHWVWHMSQKNWVSPEDLANIRRARMDIYGIVPAKMSWDEVNDFLKSRLAHLPDDRPKDEDDWGDDADQD
jgi:hypothetical protein